jgi:nicotinamidase-related amidase
VGLNAAAELLVPGRTALVVVDLQERLLPAIDQGDRVLANTRLLLHLARALELPVLVTTQYRRGLGDTVADVRALAGDASIDKTAFGCFGDAGFRERLAALGRDRLLVAGVESHVCVAQTVLGALADGRVVHVVADAVGSRTAENRAIGLSRMERAGAVVSSAEMAVYELVGRSDSAAFKALLPHIKGRPPL